MKNQSLDTNRTPARAYFGRESIDRDAEVPIGVQLVWALRARIDDGTFIAGQRLPGLRELADEAGVNINTVRAVYQRLEHEGLIDSQQGTGTFVAPVPGTVSSAAAIAANAAREARERGVDPREVAAALYVSGERPAHEPRRESQLGSRRQLRQEITVLERALAEIEAEYPGIALPPDRPRRSTGPSLLGAEELANVRASLIRRLATVQAAIEERLGEAPSESRRDRRSARSLSAADMEIVRGPKPKPLGSKKTARAPARAAAGTKRAGARSTSRPAVAET